MLRQTTSLPSNQQQQDDDGWKKIHVYYHKREALLDGIMVEPPNTPKGKKDQGVSVITSSGQKQQQHLEWYGQVQQDKAIVDLLGTSSGMYFVDLAANDAKEFSNTLALEHKGWTGLCLEPNPQYWYGLAHRKCTVVGALVGGKPSKNLSQEQDPVLVKFRGVFGGIVGRMDEKLANFKKEPSAAVEKRYTVPLVDVLQKYHVPQTIDYMSLDVEGAEYLIMQDFPFDTYTIRVMTIERPTPELIKLLHQHDYLQLKELAWWGETLWAHKSTGFTPDHPKVLALPTEQRNTK